jgi:hypothetical protein
MARGQEAEDRGQQIVRRKAIIFCSKTTADCPLGADCLSIDAETKTKTLCGYYAGSVTNGEGSQVYCEYSE